MHFERRKSRSWTSRKCNNRVVSECRFRPEAQPKTENNRSGGHEDHPEHLKLLLLALSPMLLSRLKSVIRFTGTARTEPFPGRNTIRYNSVMTVQKQSPEPLERPRPELPIGYQCVPCRNRPANAKAANDGGLIPAPVTAARPRVDCARHSPHHFRRAKPLCGRLWAIGGLGATSLRWRICRLCGVIVTADTHRW
jgi:hypothetical protein